VRIEPDINCWRLELPGSWEAYLAQLSKSHRKQLRRLENRVLAAGRARLHTITQPEELDRGLAVLIDLHQRRWRACGQPGVFGAPRFRAFHRDVARQFLESGQLRLHWLELDGQPAAAEYDFAGDGVIYSYQSGVDPARRAEEPGRLITIAVIQAALAEGCRAIDFLRGDEPYKAHWRAEPRACLRAEIVAPTWSARVRDEAFVRARAARRWWRNRWHGTVHAPREPRVEYASGAADEVPRQRPPDDRPTTLDHGHPRRSEESRPQSRDPDQAFEVVPQDSAR
jgi:CelD/BcsL family acetyltransferase involved in cellulose biosynthesis